jgi:hypothetical protein
LSAESNDDSWIDGSHPRVKKNLAELLRKVYDMGAQESREFDSSHAALGAIPGAFDE